MTMKFKKLILIILSIIMVLYSLKIYFYYDEVKYHQSKLGEYIESMEYSSNRVLD